MFCTWDWCPLAITCGEFWSFTACPCSRLLSVADALRRSVLWPGVQHVGVAVVFLSFSFSLWGDFSPADAEVWSMSRSKVDLPSNGRGGRQERALSVTCDCPVRRGQERTTNLGNQWQLEVHTCWTVSGHVTDTAKRGVFIMMSEVSSNLKKHLNSIEIWWPDWNILCVREYVVLMVRIFVKF